MDSRHAAAVAVKFGEKRGGDVLAEENPVAACIEVNADGTLRVTWYVEKGKVLAVKVQ